MKLSWLYRATPKSIRRKVFNRATRPAGSDWLRPRYGRIAETVGRSVTSVVLTGGQVRVGLDDGSARSVDHIVEATGFQIDVAKYEFLSADIERSIRTVEGQPVLGRGLECSIPGLHFLGAASELSFGPLMRAVAGTSYAARELASFIGGLL